MCYIRTHTHTQHQSNIIHRDIKAENILLTNNSLIKLADFGFSVECPPGIYLNRFCGSPPYAAPELFTENRYLGRPVDIWAAGVTLYLMLTGNMPFAGSQLEVVKANVIRGQFTVPESLTPSCKELIHGLLTTSVDKRLLMEEILGSKWLEKGLEVSRIINFSMIGASPSNGAKRTDQFYSTSTLSGTRSALPKADSSLNPDILEDLRAIGLPVEGVNFLGEPRNPTIGTYRILLHRLHSELWEMWQAKRGRSLSLGATTKVNAMRKDSREKTRFRRSRISSGLPRKNSEVRLREQSSRVCIIL